MMCSAVQTCCRAARVSQRHDDNVGYCTEEAHHHPILLIEPTDLAATGLAGVVQRHYAIHCRDQVADHLRPARIEREREPTVE